MRAERASKPRLVGIDVARCLALVGMIATHVLVSHAEDGTLALPQQVAGGRAAALFAVLAGVSIALTTGRATPVRGRVRAARSLGLVVRALLIGALGMGLAILDTGIAVILSYYAVLFVLAIPFLGLRAPALAGLAVLWTVAAPVLSFWLRPMLPERGVDSPSFGQLADPASLLAELTFTGYYPAVPWLAYLFAGMALGRLAGLGTARVAGAIAAGGAVLAAVAWLASDLLLRLPSVHGPWTEGYELTPEELRLEIAGGMYGNVPTDGLWQWLFVVAPHSTTPFDLAHTIGTALLVTGLAVLLVDRLPSLGRRIAGVVFGAGAMTLTLYSLHLLMRSDRVWPAEEPETFRWHVLVVLVVGAAFALLRRRGPLETVVSWLAGLAGRLVSGREPEDRPAAG